VTKKQIFIHSLFRTGSTYLWNKFRQQDNFYCYYEPFHPSLMNVTLYNLESILTKDYKAVHHPTLSTYYLYEYRRILTPEHRGLPYFKKSFSFDEFCHNTDNQDALRYINHLVKHAEDKIPVFQFNRSAGRCRWFAENFPAALNIYLVRNPRHQWQSYWELFQRTNYATFFIIDLQTASLNAENEPFKPLANHLPLFPYSIDKYEKEENFYRVALRCYSDEEKYLIFYYTWLWTLIENVLHADIHININRLSSDPAYRDAITQKLGKYKVTHLDFGDAEISEYSQSHLPESKMKQIEKKAHQLVQQLYSQEEIDTFFEKLPPEDHEYFQISQQQFMESKKTKLRLPSQQMMLHRYSTILSTLADEWLQLKTSFGNLHLTLKDKDEQLWQKDEQYKKKENELEHKTNYIRRLREQLREQEMELETKWGQWNQQFQALSSENQYLIKTNLILLEKNSDLLKKETSLHQRYEESRSQGSQLSRQLEDLARQNQNLMNKNHQLIDKHQEFEQILNSESFRRWRSTTLAFKKLKYFFKKKLRNNHKKMLKK
jgi:hypothetical protein